MADAAKIIAEQSVEVDIDAVKPYRKNPRVGDVDAIRESIRETGFFAPIIVQKSTGEILAGNHRWRAAKEEGLKTIPCVYVDVDDTAAKKIVLADNRTNDLATYNTDILADILSGLPTPVGTGYDDQTVRTLLAGIQDRDTDLIKEVVRPDIRVDFEGADEDEWDLSQQIAKAKDRHDARFGDEGTVEATAGSGSTIEELRVAESIASIQVQLERLEDSIFDSSNYWGVPDLRPDMLLDVLPDPINTWGGQDATPDDGVTTWLWNYGLAASKGLPWDRAIASFFTYDTKFDSLFQQPAFQVARFIHNGMMRAIVPDTSFWVDDTRYHHLSAQFSAQLMGRFMQEAGMKVIPRFMWCDLESIKVGTLGIPKNPPIAAVCIQAIDRKEVEKQMTPEGLRMFVKEIQPDALIVYGGGTAKKVVEQAVLPKSLHVVHVDNYAAVRRHVVFDNQTGKTLVEKEKRKAARAAKQAAKEAGNQSKVKDAEEVPA